MELEHQLDKINSTLNIMQPIAKLFAVFNIILVAILIFQNINIGWKIGLIIALVLMSIWLWIVSNKR